MNKKHFYECKCEFNGGICYSKQKWNNDKCQCKCKKTIKHRVCEEDQAYTRSICACKCYKDCDIGEYLKDCTYLLMT